MEKHLTMTSGMASIYDEVMQKLYILRAQGRGYNQYIEELAGRVPAM